MQTSSIQRIVAVGLNPAIDRIVEVSGLTIGAHQHARLLARLAAGKAVNVARGLSSLDVPSVLTGLVGKQEHDFFAHDLEGTSVQMRILPVAGHTRENITLVDPASRVETHLRDRGFEVSPAELAAIERELGRLSEPGTVLIFSGSLPPGVAPSDQAQMVRSCRKAGSQVVLDASGPALAAAVEAGPWLIKPNRHELEDLLGRPLADREDLLAAGRQLARSIPLVLVSCGAEGAYLFGGELAWHGRRTVPPEQIVSTVGCGDALLTGFMAGMYRTMEIEECLRLAVAAAAATATNQTASFTREQFDRFWPGAQVTALDK